MAGLMVGVGMQLIRVRSELAVLGLAIESGRMTCGRTIPEIERMQGLVERLLDGANDDDATMAVKLLEELSTGSTNEVELLTALERARFHLVEYANKLMGGTSEPVDLEG